MKTISDHFNNLMKDAIHESKWFRTAPLEFQKTAKIKILGVEEHLYHSLLAGSKLRPALVAECECGQETQRFVMLLDGVNPVECVG